MAKIKKTGRHTGALKAARQTLRHRSRNIHKKSAIKGFMKTTLAAVKTNDKTKAAEGLKEYYSQVDKAVKTGLLHWRTGARKKSHLGALVAKANNGASAVSPTV